MAFMSIKFTYAASVGIVPLCFSQLRMRRHALLQEQSGLTLTNLVGPKLR